MDLTPKVCKFSPLRTPLVKLSKKKIDEGKEPLVSDTESVITRDIVSMAKNVTRKLNEDSNNNMDEASDDSDCRDLFITQKVHVMSESESELTDSSRSESPTIPSQDSNLSVSPQRAALKDRSPKKAVLEVPSPKKSEKLPVEKGKEPLRYTVPEGFGEIKDTSQFLTQAGLVGKQLFLIQAPFDFDITKLNGEKVNLEKTHRIKLKEKNKTTAEYEVISLKQDPHLAGTFCSLGSNSMGRLTTGPPISGRLQVTGPFEDLPEVKLKEYQPVHHVVPEDLRPRYKPFGSESPERYKPEVLQETSPGKKKKKKKRKHEKQENKELNSYDSEIVFDTYVSTAEENSHSSVKKLKTDLPDHKLSDEDVQTDTQSFKKKKKKKKHKTEKER